MNARRKAASAPDSSLRFKIYDSRGFEISQTRTYRAAEICKSNYEFNTTDTARIEDTLSLRADQTRCLNLKGE